MEDERANTSYSFKPLNILRNPSNEEVKKSSVTLGMNESAKQVQAFDSHSNNKDAAKYKLSTVDLETVHNLQRIGSNGSGNYDSERTMQRYLDANRTSSLFKMHNNIQSMSSADFLLGSQGD